MLPDPQLEPDVNCHRSEDSTPFRGLQRGLLLKLACEVKVYRTPISVPWESMVWITNRSRQ
jgi:hypothetical protein